MCIRDREYEQNGGAAGLHFVWVPPADALLREAADTIRNSDLAVVCVGLNSSLEGEESKVNIPGFEGGDRTSIALPAPQEKLLELAFTSGKPIVVVLLNGSALGVASAKSHAQAIIDAWYPGQDGGTAIGAALTGELNPSGRLPVTFYESVDQLPPFTDYSMRGRTYRYFTGKPLYPFGFGLSYSDFEYSSMEVGPADVKVHVINRSGRDGDEVVQLYTTPVDSSPGMLRKLVAFQRVHLKAGETRSLNFPVASGWSGVAKVSVGGGQPLSEWTEGHFVEHRF